MSKPGGCHSSGISLGDALRLPKRHPAWRRREAQSGSGTERENLAGDAKGQGTSGSDREAESTDAPERGGLPRSSSHRLCRPTANETLLSHCRVVGIELRRRVCFFVVLKRGNARGAKGVGHRRWDRVNRQREEPDIQWKAAAFVRWHEPDDARVSSPDLVQRG